MKLKPTLFLLCIRPQKCWFQSELHKGKERLFMTIQPDKAALLPRRHDGGFEVGIYSFAELTPDPVTGATLSPAQRLHDLLETIELADQVGLDVFAIGEHHRPEFVASAPVVILAAAAARTKTIRLSSAVTVLSSDDPVRVFQDFATLDLIANGRAEIMAGRGSFIESFPLFGYDLNDYDALFAEKLDLLLTLRESERVTWAGKHRPALQNLGVYPRPVQERIPVWIAVGGTPQSAVRCASAEHQLTWLRC
jgi:alkanesulfonate monooxygenase SsuD/methylene tetrahydromethanopterin reductase-like flavin-dependent oxidoreductase (luciferase family)